MQRSLTSSTPGSSNVELNPAFNILIVYEDFAAGMRAKETYDFLVHQLGQDCRFSHQMWKFGVLNIPKLRELAVQDALLADIVIVAVSGNELPPYVTDWIESWLAQPNNVLALVALADLEAESAPGSIAARAYLEQAARRGGMEFFTQPDIWPERLTDKSFPGAQASQKQRALATLTNAIQPDVGFPRWGINE